MKPAGESPSFVVGATDRCWARRMPLILLIGGLVGAACYYAVAVSRGSGGHPAPPQSDTLIYMQYARAMADGHPYIFNPGDTPSTGSTSHLYPAVLALAYLLGAHGEALLSAGFFINVCCYLVWLQLFWLVARRCVPGQAMLGNSHSDTPNIAGCDGAHPSSQETTGLDVHGGRRAVGAGHHENCPAMLAAGLVLLNGHLALVVLGQSDAGLFLALAWGLLAALLYGRFRWATALAVLCVLARPEGMVLAAGLALLAVVLAWRRATCARQFLRVAGGGLLAVAAVPILNRLLTGMWQFQSVAGKGYLNSFPLVGALGCAANDLLTLLREVLFNLGAAPRQNYFPPVIGGCLAIIGMAGVFSDWRRRAPPSRKNTGLEGRTPASPVMCGAILIWWIGCCLAALGLIALSEFQGQGNDRYLAWMLPSWYLLAAAGVGQVARLIDRRQTMVALGMILLGFEAGTWPYFLARYATQDVQMQALVSFGRKAHAALPSGTPLGMLEGTGLRYYFGDRPVRHLNGITSSAFRGQRDLVCAIETLRHEPNLRFGCWLVPASLRGWCEESGLLGACVLTDTDGPPDGYAFGLFDARWDSMPEASLLPLDAAVTNALASMQLVDRLDVGYVPDERRCDYCFGSRLPDARFLPFVGCRRLGPERITEVGQPVIGWDEFRIAAPQRLRPMRVVLRTALDATCTVVRTNARTSGEGVHLRSPLRLRLLVNGMALPEMEVPVTCASDAFAECLLEIPGEAVTTDPLDIVIAGDHLALGYWFYQ